MALLKTSVKAFNLRTDQRGWTYFLLGVLLCVASGAFAIEPEEVLEDPALEARARSIASDLRCLVCQNQTVDESDAPFAADLRFLIREQLLLGQTDAQIEGFLASRYGERILLRPPFQAATRGQTPVNYETHKCKE